MQVFSASHKLDIPVYDYRQKKKQIHIYNGEETIT